jgi:hypothetical protein
MALVKERDTMIDTLRSMVGEHGTVVDYGDYIIGNAPNKQSMYDQYYQNNPDKLKLDEIYKAEITTGNYWQLFTKRGGVWVKT